MLRDNEATPFSVISGINQMKMKILYFWCYAAIWLLSGSGTDADADVTSRTRTIQIIWNIIHHFIITKLFLLFTISEDSWLNPMLRAHTFPTHQRQQRKMNYSAAFIWMCRDSTETREINKNSNEIKCNHNFKTHARFLT